MRPLKMVTFDVTSPAGVMSETVNSGPSEPPFRSKSGRYFRPHR